MIIPEGRAILRTAKRPYRCNGCAAMAARMPKVRLSLTLLTLVMFLLQGFIVQTHVHLHAHGPVAVTSVSMPDIDDHGHDDGCLLCKEAVHGGGFLLPSLAATLPPFVAVSLLPLIMAPRATPTPSHNWHGRAPPIHR